MPSTSPPEQRRPLMLSIGVRALVAMVVTFALAFGTFTWLDSRVARFDGIILDPIGVLPSAAPTEQTDDDPEPGPTAEPDRIGSNVRSYLVYSTGSSNMTREEAERFGVADLGRRGEDGLTDVMLVVMVDEITREAAMLSIPRDTWIPELSTRINGVLELYGVQRMVDTVGELTGLPINHLIEVNFTAFGELVEVLDGVPVQVEEPLRDYFSGLWLPEPGCILMDPLTALAYVRSRHTESTNARGGWGLYGLGGDFGRTERQRRFLSAAWNDLRGPGLLTTVPELFGVMTRNVTIDDGIGLGQVRSLADAFRSISGDDFESYLLPGRLGRAGEASVVRVNTEEAAPILRRLRNWPPSQIGQGPGAANSTETEPPTDGASPGPVDPAAVAATPTVTPTPTPAVPTQTEPAGPPCTREIAQPAPGTPPPGTPPSYLFPDIGDDEGGDAVADDDVAPDGSESPDPDSSSTDEPEGPAPVARPGGEDRDDPQAPDDAPSRPPGRQPDGADEPDEPADDAPDEQPEAEPEPEPEPEPVPMPAEPVGRPGADDEAASAGSDDATAG